jgi:hypothetical protein
MIFFLHAQGTYNSDRFLITLGPAAARCTNLDLSAIEVQHLDVVGALFVRAS